MSAKPELEQYKMELEIKQLRKNEWFSPQVILPFLGSVLGLVLAYFSGWFDLAQKRLELEKDKTLFEKVELEKEKDRILIQKNALEEERNTLTREIESAKQLQKTLLTRDSEFKKEKNALEQLRLEGSNVHPVDRVGYAVHLSSSFSPKVLANTLELPSIKYLSAVELELESILDISRKHGNIEHLDIILNENVNSYEWLARFPFLKGLKLTGTINSAALVPQLQKLPELVSLSVVGGTISLENVKNHKPNKKLKFLKFEGDGGNDALLAFIALHPTLESVCIRSDSASFSSRAFRELAVLKSVRSLELCKLSNVAIGDLKFVIGGMSLQEFRASRLGLGRGAIAELVPAMQQLRYLDCSYAALSNSDANALSKLTMLETFVSTSSELPAELVPALSKLTHLENLVLNFSQILGDSLEYLTGNKALKRLHLGFCKGKLENIPQLAHLQEIDLSGIQPNLDLIKDLSLLPSLDTIYWCEVDFTSDRMMKDLLSLRVRKLVSLASCDLSQESYAIIVDTAKSDRSKSVVTSLWAGVPPEILIPIDNHHAKQEMKSSWQATYVAPPRIVSRGR